MADQKISALTSATTPLAGTEVLPIVQSGATVKVSVDNLTTGKAVSATQYTASTGNFIQGASGKGLTTSGSLNLGLGTNGSTSQVIVDTGGNLLVGPSSQVNTCLVSLSPGAGKNGINLPVSSGTTGVLYNGTGAFNYNAHVFNYNVSTQVGFIQVQSALTLYSTTSDIRLKDDQGLATQSRIDNIKVHNFTWKSTGDAAVGVFAQELEQIIPEAVAKGTDDLNEQGLPKNPWGVDYSRIVPDLIVTCQQLKAELSTLKSEFAAYVASHP